MAYANRQRELVGKVSSLSERERLATLHRVRDAFVGNLRAAGFDPLALDIEFKQGSAVARNAVGRIVYADPIADLWEQARRAIN